MSRRRSWNWIFGSNAHINFSGGFGIAATGPSYPPDYIAQGEGCDTVSDPVTGDLLFHTNGTVAFDSNYSDITPAGGVSGTPNIEANLAMQAITVVKTPGADTLYHLFFVGNWTTSQATVRDIRYRTLDTDGYVWGSVTTLDTAGGGVGYAENLTSALHANNTDFWIITKMKNNNIIRIWPLTSGGVGAPVSRVISFTTTGNNRYGQIKISPSGKRLALGLGGVDTAVGNNPVLTVWTFDNSDASLSNERILVTGDQLPNAHSIIGVDFSPNSSIVYASSEETPFRVYKAVLWSEICHTLYYKDSTATRGATQLGVDGRIYIASAGNTWVQKLNNPDLEGDNINLLTLNIDNNTIPGGSPSTCGKGLPVVPQDAVADSINDYRIYHGTTWYSVCNGDTLRYYDADTAAWKELAVGDKFWANGAWRTIECTLVQQLNYTCYDIVGFVEPEFLGYDPPFNSSFFTASVTDQGAIIGSSVRISGPLYDGTFTVVSNVDTGSAREIVFQHAYLGNDLNSKFIV
jgi:hypothetical protein